MENPTSIEQRRDEVLRTFHRFENWEDRYLEIMRIGRELQAMPPQGKIDTFLVRGCQSKTWLFPEFKNGRLYFWADSEAAITKGIIALLIKVYSGSTLDEILALKPDFLKEIGITEHLSMSRSNGLANMIALLRIYAMGFKGRASQAP